MICHAFRNLVMIALLVFSTGFSAARADSIDPAETFRLATQKYEQAIALRVDDPQHANAMLAEAIRDYLYIIDVSGITSPALEFNLANAYLNSDDLGRAILHYRRAQQLAPNLPGLDRNLTIARSRVRTAVDTDPENSSSFARVALFWHEEWSARTRAWLFAGVFAIGWLCAAAHLINPRRFPLWLIVILFICAIPPAISLTTEAVGRSESPAVVIAMEVTARTGPGERAYAAAFQEPITAGVELTIIDQRADWVYIQLPDGRTAWLPRASVETI